MTRQARKTFTEILGQRRGVLEVATYDFGGGVMQRYDVYRLRNSAAVLPVDAEGHVYLVEEFAPGVDGWALGLARGGIDAAETAEDAARRELREEAGLACGRLELLWDDVVVPNTSTWRVTLFVGWEATPVVREGGDEAGDVRVHKMTLAEAEEKVRCGEVRGALAALGILMLADKMRGEN